MKSSLHSTAEAADDALAPSRVVAVAAAAAAPPL